MGAENQQIPLTSNARSVKIMEKWFGGLNSLLHPSSIGQNQYAWGENILTRGGIPQTRPGMRFLSSIQGKILQGMSIFQPSNSIPYMVVAVDGFIYRAPSPFKKFTRIKGLKFLANAPIINFCATLQSVTNNLDGTITVIAPKKVLIVQDGETRAGIWDGSSARHANPQAPSFEIPTGLWMAWANSRLWVARGPIVFVGDIGNPISFTEDTFLAERSHFSLPGDCTGLAQTTDLTGMLAFTSRTVTSFQSSIRTRSDWQTTSGFQTLLLSNVGCVAGRSIVNQYGITFWLSQRGVVGLDAALATKHTSRMITMDGEMARSKNKMPGDLSRACAVAFENLFLISVPSGSRENNHTWVQDQTPAGEGSDAAQAFWAGIWTGFRPLAWALNPFGDRCYCAAYDASPIDSTQIHIWEAFDPSREDNQGGRISCQFETAMTGGILKQRFAYAEIDLCEIWGDVDLEVYVGGIKGDWIKILETHIQAERGCFGSSEMPLITKDSVIESYRPQTRTIRTPDFMPPVGGRQVETKDIPGVDKAHGLLFQWKGRMGISRVAIVTSSESTSASGTGHPSEEGQHNILKESI